MKNYQIIVEPMPNPPQPHELKAAFVIATYFKTDMIFLRPNDYGTPDLKNTHTDEVWELKSPLGKSKKTIENNLREARKQSQNIIVDLSRCKLNELEAISRTKFYLKQGHRNIKQLKIIKKNGKILDILP